MGVQVIINRQKLGNGTTLFHIGDPEESLSYHLLQLDTNNGKSVVFTCCNRPEAESLFAALTANNFDAVNVYP